VRRPEATARDRQPKGQSCPPAPHLTPQEKRILAGLGNRPWTKSRHSSSDLLAARALWADVRQAVGFSHGYGGWMTTEVTSPKMAKSGVPTAGVNIHAAQAAAHAWARVGADRQADLAALFGVSVAEVADVLTATVCPRSTPGRRASCVVAHSRNAQNERTVDARLARSLLTLLAPEQAVVLSAHAIERLVARYGKAGARFRTNVSDDLRWELLAPALFDVGPRAYAYTKWSPADRPGRRGLQLVYSATERSTPAEVAAMCAAGHRVAVVLDVAKSTVLPEHWACVPGRGRRRHRRPVAAPQGRHRRPAGQGCIERCEGADAPLRLRSPGRRRPGAGSARTGAAAASSGVADGP